MSEQAKGSREEQVRALRCKADKFDGGLRVFCALMDCLDGDDECWPGVPWLMESTGRGRDKVKNRLADLAEAKVIADTGRRAGPRGRTTVWHVDLIDGSARSAPVDYEDAEDVDDD